MNVSKKYIIGIKEFLSNYILSKKDIEKGEFVGTHNEMNLCLFENGYIIPERVSFKQIKKTDILLGEVIFVKDKTGKVISYRNPKKVNMHLLQEELNSPQNKKKALKERREYLKEKGYVETMCGDVIKKELIDEQEDIITHKLNRNKILANTYGKRGMIGLK